jgi:hypothetical protein
MDQGSTPSLKMILPPDGKQTRIDFFIEKHPRKGSSDWWHSISSIFRREVVKKGPKLEIFNEVLGRKGYFEKTRKTYLFMVKRFFNYFETLDPQDITMGEIEDYNFDFFVSGRYSRSYQLQFINAISLYYLFTDGIELNLKHLRKTGIGRKSI